MVSFIGRAQHEVTDVIQVSVMNDMGAIPNYMTESLSKAKGTWGHAAAQAVKGAAYGAANLVTSEEKK